MYYVVHTQYVHVCTISFLICLIRSNMRQSPDNHHASDNVLFIISYGNYSISNHL